MAGADQVIPPHILKNAKGLAVLTVLKAGFLFSGRAGSGVIVARLPDGSWSAPSAIVTAGAGVGGQVGAELTDFVFILNTQAAVDSFAQFGSITLGANVSVAAGPLGRNAEGGGTASFKGAAAIFSYSKTKGLFAGVSLEGSAIVERREANRKFYGNTCKASQVLSGKVEPPPACDTLMRVLESRVFNNNLPYDSEDDFYNDGYYDDIPDEFSDTTSESPRRPRSSRFSSYRRLNSHYSDDGYSDDDFDDSYNSRRRRRAGSTRDTSYSNGKKSAWEDDIYDAPSRGSAGVDDLSSRLGNTRISASNGPLRPSASSKPNFGSQTKSNSNQAIALYTFKGEQNGDLPFKKGDVIDILKKTETSDDWWTGRNNGMVGIFPANYVELI